MTARCIAQCIAVPNRRIDNHHDLSSTRMSSKSPSHSSLPRQDVTLFLLLELHEEPAGGFNNAFFSRNAS
jgi:hypothetical protein